MRTHSLRLQQALRLNAAQRRAPTCAVGRVRTLSSEGISNWERLRPVHTNHRLSVLGTAPCRLRHSFSSVVIKTQPRRFVKRFFRGDEGSAVRRSLRTVLLFLPRAGAAGAGTAVPAAASARPAPLPQRTDGERHGAGQDREHDHGRQNALGHTRLLTASPTRRRTARRRRRGRGSPCGTAARRSARGARRRSP